MSKKTVPDENSDEPQVIAHVSNSQSVSRVNIVFAFLLGIVLGGLICMGVFSIYIEKPLRNEILGLNTQLNAVDKEHENNRNNNHKNNRVAVADLPEVVEVVKLKGSEVSEVKEELALEEAPVIRTIEMDDMVMQLDQDPKTLDQMKSKQSDSIDLEAVVSMIQAESDADSTPKRTGPKKVTDVKNDGIYHELETIGLWMSP